jgi:eukaryotic-like serine/threonine-protein kinase
MEPQVGPYRIIERLGAGGMGEVYLAEDPRLGRRVALKRLSDPALSLPEARARLLREAAMAATLNHPNIAAVYDVLESGGEPFLVMEYVPGETLAALLKRGPVPVDRVVQIGLQLCDALGEAHAHGVVHRDLKPTNVRVTPEGRAKILDFGLARPVAGVTLNGGHAALAQSLAVAERQLVGTPAYVAPEVLLGRSAGPRADIYSLGVTLFELATGKVPFPGHSFIGVALAILTEPPPPVAEMLPGGLGEIVARAMARETAQRYQRAQQVRRDLASLSDELTELPTGVIRLPERGEGPR